jgi:N-methylhydantoinase B
VALLGADGSERELNSKGSFTAAPGARVWLRAPGAGGYGPPAERDPARLRADVIDGYVSAEAAASAYGRRDRASLSCPDCATPGERR